MSLTKAHSRMLTTFPQSVDDLYAFTPVENEIEISATLAVGGNTAYLDLPYTVFKQADNADLSTLIALSVSSSTYSRVAGFNLHVDGNKANNTASVTGIKCSLMKRNSNSVMLSASDCDVGINITDNVEYAKMDLHADGCGTGVLVDTDSSLTPDELTLNVLAHDCDTFFEASGTSKMTTHTTFGCEQSNSYGAVISQGWHQIFGELRGVGKTGGGGIKISDAADVMGSVRVLGGDNTNCEWCADIQGGDLRSLELVLGASFKNGCRILGGTEGSARIILQSSPNATGSEEAVKLGDSTGSSLNGFQILPGSEITSGNIAVNLDNAVRCVINPVKLVGEVVIGANSSDNTIYVPRRNAETLVSFTNNRTQQDNKIIFQGSYTTAEMDAFNGGTSGSGCFKGMEVESCSSLNGARAYFDGTSWTSY